ncbi:MAG: alpha/beta fold hydrolase [Patescibacteria group bacterium]
MKKVFLIHGFRSSPNGGWRPWLLGELAAADVYACALSMPSPEAPEVDAWVAEIARYAERDAQDELYLVGHSLGVPAILRFLERAPEHMRIAGAVLVSGPIEPLGENASIHAFLQPPFNFDAIRSKIGTACVIHGDDDALVPVRHAEMLAQHLSAELVIVPHGGHLNGSGGWKELPQVKDALLAMTGERP